MLNHDILILILLIGNVAITLLLVWHHVRLKKMFSDFRIENSTEISEASGAFKKSKKVVVKSQVFLGNLPIGGPIVVSESVQEEVSMEKMEAILNTISNPLARIGFRVIRKKITGI